MDYSTNTTHISDSTPRLLIDREAHSVATLPRQSPDSHLIEVVRPVEVPVEQPIIEKHVHQEKMVIFDVKNTPENLAELREIVTNPNSSPRNEHTHHQVHHHNQHQYHGDNDKHLHHRYRHAHEVGHAPHDHSHHEHIDHHHRHDHHHTGQLHNDRRHHHDGHHDRHNEHRHERKLRPEDDPLTGTIGSTSNRAGTTGFGNIAGPIREDRPATEIYEHTEITETRRSPLRDMEIAPGVYYSPFKVGGDRLSGERDPQVGSREDHTEHHGVRSKLRDAERKAQEAFGGTSSAGKEWNRMT